MKLCFTSLATLFTFLVLTSLSYAQAPLPSAIASDGKIVQKTESVLEPHKKAVLQTLDKVTGRTGSATVTVGETVKLGTLYLAVRTCRKAPPIEQPESAAFIQVWQPIRDEAGNIGDIPESEWVFSGWMYASSPSVSAMDHPVFDVWLTDCKN